MLEIPIEADTDWWSQEVPLDGTTYTLEFFWAGDRWLFTMSTPRAIIVHRWTVITESRVLPRSGPRPPGELVFVQKGPNEVRPVGRQELGGDDGVHLLYLPAAEVVHLPELKKG